MVKIRTQNNTGTLRLILRKHTTSHRGYYIFNALFIQHLSKTRKYPRAWRHMALTDKTLKSQFGAVEPVSKDLKGCNTSTLDLEGVGYSSSSSYQYMLLYS